MMFMLNSPLSLQIIALVASVFLLSWGLQQNGQGRGIAKLFGFFATLIALFSLIFSLYFAFTFWREGRAIHQMLNVSTQTAGSATTQGTATKAAISGEVKKK